ncbi:peptidase U35 [Thioclava sp. JM3]|nr:peptidase U35 [Thioclava sp. JM3]
MDMNTYDYGLELKFCANEAHPVQLTDGTVIEGYASLFGLPDQGGDVVCKGAYAKGLERLLARGGTVKMLWQHDPAQPIGIWDDIREDARGLYVKGRLLPGVARAREATALIAARAIDGLSIGYRTVAAEKDAKGRRLLAELELWEVSLVTFPMLREARVAAKGESLARDLRDLAAALRGATAELAGR